MLLEFRYILAVLLGQLDVVAEFCKLGRANIRNSLDGYDRSFLQLCIHLIYKLGEVFRLAGVAEQLQVVLLLLIQRGYIELRDLHLLDDPL